MYWLMRIYFQKIRLNDADIISAHNTQFQWEHRKIQPTCPGIEKLEMSMKRKFFRCQGLRHVEYL